MQIALLRFATEGCRAGGSIDKTWPRVSSAELNSAAGAKKGLKKEGWQQRESSHSYLHFGNCVVAGHGQVDREGPGFRSWHSTERRYLCQKWGNGSA